MDPTPVEDRADERSGSSRERDGRGVRRRLWGAVSRFTARFLDAVAEVVAPAGQRARETKRRDGGTTRNRDRSREAVAIRPSGQARLESGPADSPSGRSTGQEARPEVAARVRGDRLRVYDPDADDAYISSDVYERVQR